MWNEPNTSLFWRPQNGATERYAACIEPPGAERPPCLPNRPQDLPEGVPVWV